MRKLERVERGLVAGPDRGLDLGGADLKPKPADFDPVEPKRQLGKRLIAALAHVVDDVGDREVDVGGGLALGGEERGEALIEIRRPHIERDGHG